MNLTRCHKISCFLTASLNDIVWQRFWTEILTQELNWVTYTFTNILFTNDLQSDFQTWIKFYLFRYFIQDKIREYIKFFRILYCFVFLNLILMIIIKLYLTLSLLQIFSWTNYNCYVFHLFILSHLFLYEAASQLFVYIQQAK